MHYIVFLPQDSPVCLCVICKSSQNYIYETCRLIGEHLLIHPIRLVVCGALIKKENKKDDCLMGRGVRKPLWGFVWYLFYFIPFYFVLISTTEFKIEGISSLWSSLADWLTKTKIGRRTKQAHHAMIPVVFHYEKFSPSFPPHLLCTSVFFHAL